MYELPLDGRSTLRIRQRTCTDVIISSVPSSVASCVAIVHLPQIRDRVYYVNSIVRRRRSPPPSLPRPSEYSASTPMHRTGFANISTQSDGREGPLTTLSALDTTNIAIGQHILCHFGHVSLDRASNGTGMNATGRMPSSPSPTTGSARIHIHQANASGGDFLFVLSPHIVSRSNSALSFCRSCCWCMHDRTEPTAE